MANQFVNLPVPAGNGVGASVDVSTFGASKSIVVGGDCSAQVTIEVNNDAGQLGGWAALKTFQNTGELVVDVACRWMRVRVSNYNVHVGGQATCDVGGTDDGASFQALAAPVGNGAAASSNTSALGEFKTVQCGGQYRGSVIVEVSEDGSSWGQPFAFGSQSGGIKSLLVTAEFMRVRRVGVPKIDPGIPVVTVGACVPGGGGGGGGVDVDRDGALVVAAATTLNFLGARVVNAGGGEADITPAAVFDNAAGPLDTNIRGARLTNQSPIDNTKAQITNFGSQDHLVDPAATGATGVGSTIGGGNDNSASGDGSTIPGGVANIASGVDSYAEGHGCQATGPQSHAEGALTIASGPGGGDLDGMGGAHAEGHLTVASGKHSHAEGAQSVASGVASHAEGASTVASGLQSHAEGFGGLASGAASHAEGGNRNTASGQGSHAEGSANNTASGAGSHAEGGGSATASGAGSHAEGIGTLASGAASHAEGGSLFGSSIQAPQASGDSSHAEGYNSSASGICSHAEGISLSSGFCSHSEGGNAQATGHSAHCEGGFYADGLADTNLASGGSSHAQGRGVVASGVASHAQGSFSTASRPTQDAHASGRLLPVYFGGGGPGISVPQTNVLCIGAFTSGQVAAQAVALTYDLSPSAIFPLEFACEDGKAYTFSLFIAAGGTQVAAGRVSRGWTLFFNARCDAGVAVITGAWAGGTNGDPSTADWTLVPSAIGNQIIRFTFTTGAIASKCCVGGRLQWEELPY